MYLVSADIRMEMETVELCITLLLFIIVFVFTCLSLFILLAFVKEKVILGKRELNFGKMFTNAGVKETFLKRSLQV